MGIYYRLWILALLAGTTVDMVRSTDWQMLVYQGCSQEQYAGGSTYQSNLNTVLKSIVSEGSSATFYYNTSAGYGDDAVYGLFQCRGDLTNADCSKCRKNVVSRAPGLCGKSRGATIQLLGCYLRYDGTLFIGEPDTQLIHKTCSPRITVDPGFFYLRDNVFAGLEQASFSQNDFSVTSSGDSGTGVVYGFAQCEGDLSMPYCATCILAAIQNLKDVCGSSVAGEVYLQKCYVSYAQNISNPNHGSGSSHVTAKTAAITVGILAAVGFAIVLFFFLKSLCKNRE